MTDPAPPAAHTPEAEEFPSELPAPLQGCLYCHAEGSTALSEGRTLFGRSFSLGSFNLGRLNLGGPPGLTCRACGSVAQFVAGPADDPDAWRIRYRRPGRAPQYYYAMVYLGGAGWLEAEEALAISRRAYVQRLRVAQAARGDLSWLRPAPLNPPPPLMAYDERVYLTLNPATLQQTGRAAADEESVIDSGIFYVTDQKVHLLGHRRDWSHKLADLGEVSFNERHWRLHLAGGGQHYQGANYADQIDAQLFTTVIKALVRERIRAGGNA